MMSTFCFCLFVAIVSASEYSFLSKCTNAKGPLVITDAGVKAHNMFVVLQIHTPELHRRRFTVKYAARGIGTDPKVDFKRRKTMVLMDGYLDSQHMPFMRIFLGHFASKGYNTIAPDAQKIYSQIFPLAVRASYQVANKTAILMKDLMKYGLRAKDITIVGISLGGQTVSLVAKAFTKLTGEKVKQIFSLDPSGPCYSGLPSEYRLTPSDADMVQVIHTSNDGFGNGIAQGHVDFYLNGGEWQNFLNPDQPWCEDFFSHVLSAPYLYASLFIYPDQFVGVKCKNVQQAREHRCYDNEYPYETNVMGFKTDYNKTGIFYVPVRANAPLYAPRDFMEKKLVYPMIYNDALNDVEHFVLAERSLDNNISPPHFVNAFANLLG